jgi:deazaflavin-dependent oxidoreductase (nitroreductase family)
MAMAAVYRLSAIRKLVNWLVWALLSVGLGPPWTYLLTVRGRKSGQPGSTPVTLVVEGEQRWLVAPYGAVGWVRNARSAGRVTLRLGGRAETRRIVELGPEESAPVLRRYVTEVPITRPFFDVPPDSPLDVFRAEARCQPAFRILGYENTTRKAATPAIVPIPALISFLTMIT